VVLARNDDDDDVEKESMSLVLEWSLDFDVNNCWTFKVIFRMF